MEHENTNKRSYCKNCGFPQSVCLCADVRPIVNRTRVIILQHPSERKIAKNTARLLQIGLTHCTLVVGETASDFAPLRTSLSANSAVLYPSPSSMPLSPDSSPILPPESLIMLDGTWRKAYKLWQLNDWLHALPAYHLDNPPAGIYQRKAKQASQLSTLEACNLALHALEQTPTDNLLSLLKARQQKGF